MHLDLASSAAARRAFALLRGCGRPLGDPDVPPPSLRPGDALPAPRRRGRQCARRVQGSRRALAVRARRSNGRRSASSDGRAAAAHTCAARCSARARSPGPRDPHLELRTATRAGAEFVAEVAAREGVELARRRTAEPRARLREGPRRDRRPCSRSRAPADTALALEEHAVLAATRPHANRLANADEANLVRTARAAHRQLEAIRALGLDALPARLAEIAELRLRHPSASLRELAAKARPPLTKAAAHRRLNALVEPRGREPT